MSYLLNKEPASMIEPDYKVKIILNFHNSLMPWLCD